MVRTFLVIALAVGVATSDAAEATDRSSQTVPLARWPRGSVDLDVLHLLGTVTYETWDEDRIELGCVRVGTGKDPAGAAAHRGTIRLAVAQLDRRVTVSTLAWEFPDFWRAVEYIKRGEKPATVHLFIRAPRRVRPNLYSRHGSVVLRDVRGHATVKTESSPILVRGARGSLDLTTGSGAVWLEGELDSKVRVVTSSGHIRALSLTGDLDARTTAGSIFVEYKVLGLGDQRLLTESGQIAVAVPLPSNVMFRVQADPERITTSLLLTNVQTSKRTYSGTLGLPRCEMRIVNHSGPVRITGR